jgi:putative transposase
MPRTARATVGGYCYHVINRGNERAQVFHEDDDYHAFVRLLRQACVRGKRPVNAILHMLIHS